MALGQRRTERQQELWVAAAILPASIGHVFYDALNRVLRDGNFDKFAESLCEPFYKSTCPRRPPQTVSKHRSLHYLVPTSRTENCNAQKWNLSKKATRNDSRARATLFRLQHVNRLQWTRSSIPNFGLEDLAWESCDAFMPPSVHSCPLHAQRHAQPAA
jgi:transposase